MAAEFTLLKDDKKIRQYRIENDGDIGFITCIKGDKIPDLDKDFKFEGSFGWPCSPKRAALLVRQSMIVKPTNPPKFFVYGVG